MERALHTPFGGSLDGARTFGPARWPREDHLGIGRRYMERVGAVDWSNKEAYALRVDQYQATLEAMAAQATDDLLGPRRVSRREPPEEEHETLMVALTELLAVVLLAVHQHQKWIGKIVLYFGDNQVVIAWLGKRQAKHPMASFLLQTLAAIEACHGFFLHSAYLQTYHNVVADALTREDAKEVMEKAGLECLPDPTEDLEHFLDRGWQRRALVCGLVNRKQIGAKHSNSRRGDKGENVFRTYRSSTQPT